MAAGSVSASFNPAAAPSVGRNTNWSPAAAGPFKLNCTPLYSNGSATLPVPVTPLSCAPLASSKNDQFVPLKRINTLLPVTWDRSEICAVICVALVLFRLRCTTGSGTENRSPPWLPRKSIPARFCSFMELATAKLIRPSSLRVSFSRPSRKFKLPPKLPPLRLLLITA